MDEMLSELLSRYLDDDLTAAERTEFERRLEIDPTLRAEMKAGRELRRAVSRIAGEMEPPAALDAVMEPMLRSAPAPVRRVRPAFRWLGAAAAVVVGVAVTVEMARRHPQPVLDQTTSPRVINHDDEAIFELAPLPSAVPGEHRPLGATDRLAEEELLSPEAPEPAPLEIIGPLPSGDLPSGSESAKPGIAHAEKAGARPAPEPHVSAAVAADASTFRAGKGQKKRAVAAHPVELAVGGVRIWSGWSSCSFESPLGVRIQVRGGIVVAAEVRDPGVDGQGPCLPGDLVGSVVADLSDGEYSAEIVAAGK